MFRMMLTLDDLCHHNRERTLAQETCALKCQINGGGPNKQWVGKNNSMGVKLKRFNKQGDQIRREWGRNMRNGFK